MEIEELMINDWVQVPSEMNRYKRVCSTFDMDSAVLYRPIPLTSELLMQNGWEKDPETGECLLSDYDDTFEVCWIGTILTVQSGYGRMELVNCQYVHELQHALRICEIEKELKLED